ncbi:hypothetical protein FE391_43510 [Nonomuraea sp. KC401]|uniref:hypothetical protein n=1 Tax=unclassified Nonomuraea TaxID=2593643 RepID=UPI0010FECC19|nr:MULTISPECIES: hypothetical protein [unclassified Nonomuraea]NBF00228.1 hypothetical protein [Nonomuraea sp. K271]TLF52461.1 hypothetical protein FE391_43510 [Nonomuraea sp. KC401]
MTGRPPRLSRAHAVALLLPLPAGRPARTVLTLTDDTTFGFATPDAVLAGQSGRIVLTRAELLDSGIRVVPGTGGRLAPGCGARLDQMLGYLNAWLADDHQAAGAPR